MHAQRIRQEHFEPCRWIDPYTLSIAEKVPPRVGNILADHLAALNYWSFRFAELKRGDCTIRNGEFRFYEDGSSHWECDISSSDSGDEWEGSFTGGEAGYDGNSGTDKLLFAMGPHYHFDIHDKNQVKHWVQDAGPADVIYGNGISVAQAFQRLGAIVFYCGC